MSQMKPTGEVEICWRLLSAKEKEALLPALMAAEHVYAGGSLHVEEMHIVLDDVVYRYFSIIGNRITDLTVEDDIEVSWAVAKSVHPAEQHDRTRRAAHMAICREGDRFAETLNGLPEAPEAIRRELVNQVRAMQRLAMALNTPGGCLSPSTLQRF